MGNTCIENFRLLETIIGICDPMHMNITDDNKALENFSSSIRLQNSRYQIGQGSMRSSKLGKFQLVGFNLYSLPRHFQKNRNLLEKYDEVSSSPGK